MKIKQFLITVACYDDSNVQPKDVEEALYHGMLEKTGPLKVKTVGRTAYVDYPDIDYTKEGPAFDRAVGDWDQAAHKALKRRKR